MPARSTPTVSSGSPGTGAGDPRRAATTLAEALSLWRGPALADVREAPFADAPAIKLDRLRLDCVEDRVQAELDLGRHRELVAELQELAAAHPLRERLHGQLMRALYGVGRQADPWRGTRRRPRAGYGVHLRRRTCPVGSAGPADQLRRTEGRDLPARRAAW
ncbi:hypothetical protein GCM10023075_38090 [Streptosporangium album]